MNCYNSTLIKQPSTAGPHTLIWLLACHSEGWRGLASTAPPPRSRGGDPGWLRLKEGKHGGSGEFTVWVKDCAACSHGGLTWQDRELLSDL